MDEEAAHPADLVLLSDRRGGLGSTPPRWWRDWHSVLIGSRCCGFARCGGASSCTRELRGDHGPVAEGTEVSATLAERDRLAAEIHDTLEQEVERGIMDAIGRRGFARLKNDTDGAW